mmetsp:Transcript_53518/g.114428  ORF Transcript_53518/g.114428 Transcript_53518/m.114428 type:complete len:213 (-) Transcript_53518:574-1212(-)|eukprot:CAMPEP_0206459734 /NCGR_PEP_ID=MMETSP0324_2-20121206/24347_1 /ASSEMBLY_ACC=CAM_ASM_000836 /TAXON_ID=2866 /ORGANISM="Crypthecodinium cohnii, Strain Seligo" /LENGTH=212 /DNA_ID=CAMNT_0053931331 /DNA_START=99 /DNA_END=737 /DNA_ORIENTATION=+
MGAAPSCSEGLDDVQVPVTLHVYDVQGSIHYLNRLLSVWGTGAFHVGVEIYDKEWSFGQYGIYASLPCQDSSSGHSYLNSVPMGYTKMSEKAVLDLLRRLRKEWVGSEYSLLKHNCCHFSEAFCHALTGLSVPKELTSLAATGASLSDATSRLAMKVRKPSFAERWFKNMAGVCGDGGGANANGRCRGSCGEGVAKVARRMSMSSKREVKAY